MRAMTEMQKETRMKAIAEALDMNVLSNDNMDVPLNDVIYHYARG